jgi:hypothetical protein
MLLATTLTPPAVQHLHESEGESLQHGHAVPDRVAGHEDVHAWAGQVYGHDDVTGEHRAGGYAGAEVSAAHPWHLHLVLFGVEMTLPDRSPQDSQPRPEGSVLFISVRSGEDFLPSQPTGQPTFDGPAAVQTAAFAVSAAAPQGARSTSVPERSVLLCDRARHERSGVLLA